MDLVSLVHLAGLKKTKADCRRLIEQKGLQINGQLASKNHKVMESFDELFLFEKYMLVKGGKKQFKILELEG
jgi:tyrosyl-tRNA synthetase